MRRQARIRKHVSIDSTRPNFPAGRQARRLLAVLALISIASCGKEGSTAGSAQPAASPAAAPAPPAEPASAPAPAPSPAATTSAPTEPPPPPPAAAAAATPAAADSKTAQEIFAGALAAWDAIKDYHCFLRTWNRVGEKTDDKTLEFWFRPPQSARSVVIEGENQGSTVTRDAAGKMRGKKGGVLGLVVLTITEEDKRIYNIRGKKFYQADFGTMLGEWKEWTAAGWKMTRLPEDNFKNADCWVLALENPDPKAVVTKDVFWIDKKTNLIRRRNQFEKETLVNDASYWDIELNKGFGDDMYTL